MSARPTSTAEASGAISMPLKPKLPEAGQRAAETERSDQLAGEAVGERRTVHRPVPKDPTNRVFDAASMATPSG